MAEESQARNYTVGVRLREAREASGLSRQALATRLGVSVSTIDRAELHDSLPRFSVTVALCRVLDIELDDLADLALVSA